MQVSVERTSELERRMTVQLPEDVIKEKMELRLKELAKKVKLDGFRPGKVPHRVIRNRYGRRVREEIVGELVRSSFYDAISEEKLNPVGGPLITPEENKEGEGLKYSASFEVYPEVELANLSKLRIQRPVCEITQADLESMIERLRVQRTIWKAVDRPSRNGDKVTINFSGTAGEEKLTDGEVKDHPVILGSNAMAPGFEDKLLGVKGGHKLNFELDFPSDYHVQTLSDKTGSFDIDVVKVEESELPEVNEGFAKGFGIEDGNLDAFREEIKSNMERELSNTLRSRLKSTVMDALLAAHDIVLPKALIDHETKHLLENLRKTAARNAQSEKLDEQAHEQAVRRVKLGLIVNELTKQADLHVDKTRVRSTIETLAQSYQDPDEVINWYYQNPKQLKQIEQMVLEDQVVGWVVNQAEVSDEPISFSELTDLDQAVYKSQKTDEG